MQPIGGRRGTLAQGYIPGWGNGPEPSPRATPFASAVESDVPLVVRHTRLDSRRAGNAPLSTIAFACEASP